MGVGTSVCDVDLSRQCVGSICVCLIVWVCLGGVYDLGNVYECVCLSWGKIHLCWVVCICVYRHIYVRVYVWSVYVCVRI